MFLNTLLAVRTFLRESASGVRKAAIVGMKKVYSAESLIRVAHLRNLLESAGIACCIRNERLSGALGEIPFLECWPELWVLQAHNASKAQSLIQQELRAQEHGGVAWTCQTCGEWLDGQFTECWRCSDPIGPG